MGNLVIAVIAVAFAAALSLAGVNYVSRPADVAHTEEANNTAQVESLVADYEALRQNVGHRPTTTDYASVYTSTGAPATYAYAGAGASHDRQHDLAHVGRARRLDLHAGLQRRHARLLLHEGAGRLGCDLPRGEAVGVEGVEHPYHVACRAQRHAGGRSGCLHQPRQLADIDAIDLLPDGTPRLRQRYLGEPGRRLLLCGQSHVLPAGARVRRDEQSPQQQLDVYALPGRRQRVAKLLRDAGLERAHDRHDGMRVLQLPARRHRCMRRGLLDNCLQLLQQFRRDGRP